MLIIELGNPGDGGEDSTHKLQATPWFTRPETQVRDCCFAIVLGEPH